MIGGMGYLYSFLKPSHTYYQAWQEYRRRRKFAWLSTLVAMPAALIGAIIILPIALALKSDIPIAMVFGGGMIFCVWIHLRRLIWPCPRCRRAFHLMAFAFKIDFDRCKHCGLEKYAPCDPAHQEWEYADQTK
jgi:hypothetical protein